MYKYLLFLGLVFNVQAQNMFASMSPEELAEYEITITHKPTNKVVGKMSRADYKVVRLGNNALDLFTPFFEESLYRAYDEGKHEGENSFTLSVIGLTGIGPVGLKHNTEGNTTTVSPRVGQVFTGMVCGTQNKWGVCASVSNYKGVSMGIKKDFK